MTKRNRENVDENQDSYVAKEPRPLIPEGIYQAQCIKIEKGYSHSSSRKIFIHFEVFNEGELENKVPLFLAMNDPGEKVSPGTKYYQNWVIANGNKAPRRNDRMSLKVFRKGLFLVHVGTVKPTLPESKKERPECFHYSIVRYIIKKVVG